MTAKPSKPKSVVLDLTESDDPATRLSRSLKGEVTELHLSAGMGTMPVDVLAEKPRPALDTLSLDEELGDMEPACKHRPDKLWAQLPDLRRLHLRSERPLFHSIAHPKIEILALEVAPLCYEGRWELPALRALDCDPHIESECDIGALDLLWRQELPALRDLSLRGSFVTFKPTLAREEVRRFLAKLERLAIPFHALLQPPMGKPPTVSLDLSSHLIEQASHLEHLKQLVILDIPQERMGDITALRNRLPQLEITEDFAEFPGDEFSWF